MKLSVRIPKRRIFFSFVLSYLLVLLIPFLVGMAAYREVVGNLEDNATEKSLLTLNQSMAVLDRRFAEIEGLAEQIASNPKVLSFSRENNPYVDRTVPIRINELREEFRPYVGTSNFIGDIYLYFNKSDVTMSATKPHLQMDRFYGDFFRYAGMSREQWSRQIIGAKHYKDYLPEEVVERCTDYIGRNWTSQKMLMYLRSFPLTSMDRGVILILVESAKLEELLRPVSLEQGGWAYVVDGDNRVMASFSAPDAAVLPMALDLSDASGCQRSAIGGQDMIVTHTTSAHNGWRYVAVVPRSAIMLKTEHIKSVILLVFGLAFLLGTALAVAMAYRHSHPIRRIIELVRSLMGESDGAAEQNDYTFLNKSIMNLVHSTQSLKDRLARQQPLLKTTFVSRLLEGGYAGMEEIRQLSDHLGFELFRGYAVVAIARVTHAVDGAPAPIGDTSAIKLLLTDALEKRLGATTYYYDPDFERRVFVFGAGEDRQGARELADRVLNEVTEELKRTHDADVLFLVGPPAADLTLVSKAYGEAREALDYKALHRVMRVVWTDEIPRGGGSFYYPIHVETQLVNFAKLGNDREVERLLLRIHKENYVKRSLSPEVSTLLAHNLMGTLIKMLDLLAVDHADMALRVRASVAALDQCQTVEEMFSFLLSIYRDICELMSAGKRSRSDVMSEILAYMRANYADSQISLTSVADLYDFAPAYLSQLFKDSTGENFSVELERIRIEAARALLKQGMPVGEVAAKVGYNSVYVFRNAFKRVVGEAPSEYCRKIAKSVEAV